MRATSATVSHEGQNKILVLKQDFEGCERWSLRSCWARQRRETSGSWIMWRRDKKKGKAKTRDQDHAEASPSAPSATMPMPSATTNGDDAVFSHPGGFGTVMIPPKAVKVGFFEGRRRRKEQQQQQQLQQQQQRQQQQTADPSNKENDNGCKKQLQQQQQRLHPLCTGDPARVDDLLSEASESKKAEGALRDEAAKLLAKKAQLDKEIQRLQRDKEEMTEAYRAQLEKLRRDLESDAKESKRRLEAELVKGHARSMDNLRLTLKAETEHLTGETKRLREDLQRARQIRKASNTAAAKDPEKTKSFSSAAGAGSKIGSKIGSRAGTSSAPANTPAKKRGSSPTNLNGDGDLFGDSSAPSEGFWTSLTNAFSPSDILSAVPRGARGSGGGTAMGEEEGVPPPALLVLAAVPLFCFYKRWKNQRYGSSIDVFSRVKRTRKTNKFVACRLVVLVDTRRFDLI